MERGDDNPRRQRTKDPRLPLGRRPPRQRQHQRPADQRIGQPHRRQSVAHRPPIVVRRKHQEAERAASGDADGIGCKPVALPGIGHPEQRHRGPGQRDVNDRFEPDAQRQCRCQPEHQPAARAPGVGDPGDPEREERQLPAMMIDPRRDILPGRRSREEQADHDQRPRRGVDQSPDSQRQRDDQYQQGQQRRDRNRKHFGMRAIGEMPPDQDQPGNRQVDQSRPVDVRPGREVELILAKIVPALPAVEPRANLAHAHVIVGVAKHETGDVVPLGEDQPRREQRPAQHSEAAPMPVDEAHKPIGHRASLH